MFFGRKIIRLFSDNIFFTYVSEYLKESLYEYEGIVKRDEFGNPFILNLNTKEQFYLANFIDCDKYEIEF